MGRITTNKKRARAITRGYASVVTLFPTMERRPLPKIESAEETMATAFKRVGSHLSNAMSNYDVETKA